MVSILVPPTGNRVLNQIPAGDSRESSREQVMPGDGAPVHFWIGCRVTSLTHQKKKKKKDRGWEYDQQSGTQCVEGAHRFSFFACEVDMLIRVVETWACSSNVGSCLSSWSQMKAVKRISFPPAPPHKWLQRTKWYVLFLLLEVAYSNKYQFF